MNLVTNMGKVDRTARLAASLLFLAAGLLVHWVFFLFSVLAFATAVVGVCPLYTAIGVTTLPRRPRHA